MSWKELEHSVEQAACHPQQRAARRIRACQSKVMPLTRKKFHHRDGSTRVALSEIGAGVAGAFPRDAQLPRLQALPKHVMNS
jgi:hypothetical protein